MARKNEELVVAPLGVVCRCKAKMIFQSAKEAAGSSGCVQQLQIFFGAMLIRHSAYGDSGTDTQAMLAGGLKQKVWQLALHRCSCPCFPGHSGLVCRLVQVSVLVKFLLSTHSGCVHKEVRLYTSVAISVFAGIPGTLVEGTSAGNS